MNVTESQLQGIIAGQSHSYHGVQHFQVTGLLIVRIMEDGCPGDRRGHTRDAFVYAQFRLRPNNSTSVMEIISGRRASESVAVDPARFFVLLSYGPAAQRVIEPFVYCRPLALRQGLVRLEGIVDDDEIGAPPSTPPNRVGRTGSEFGSNSKRYRLTPTSTLASRGLPCSRPQCDAKCRQSLEKKLGSIRRPRRAEKRRTAISTIWETYIT
jgi:hypothetical protein